MVRETKAETRPFFEPGEVTQRLAAQRLGRERREVGALLGAEE
jgi:hypothetical protein